VVDTPGRIPEDFIQSLLSRVDIVEVINAAVPLRKAGTNYVACCPFHNEKTPSFSVNKNKQFYHCFGCGVSGDAIQFLIEHNSLSFVEAVELLAGQLGMQMPQTGQSEPSADHNLIYNILAEATAFFEQQLRQQTLAKQAVQYLKDRGLTGVTAKAFRLGFAPPGWDNLLTSIAKDPQQKEVGVKAGLFVNREGNKFYDRFRNRIVFPIRNRRGKVIGFGGRIIGSKSDEPKYLNSPETAVFSKSHELYGYYEARQAIARSNSVLVVEGYMDVVSLAQAGITNVVATLGTACTEQHVQYLFKTVPEIIFCFDGDAAGKKAAWRSLELCLPLLDDQHRVKFLILRDNEDPDSYVRKHGAAALQVEMKQAASLPDFLFTTLAKQVDLDHIDGRVQFATQIKQYLNKLPEGILKTMLFDRLAQLVNVDAALFHGKKARPLQRRKEFSQSIISKALVSPAIRALALLITYRELLAHLPEDISSLANIDIFGCNLLCAVAGIIKTAPSSSDIEIRAMLPEALREGFVAMDLRGVAHIVPKQGIIEEFLGAIEILRRRKKELVMDDLLLKAKQNVLSDADKLLLQQMLQEKG
jgi:DNA primase